jgi:putative transcriptional regulator
LKPPPCASIFEAMSQDESLTGRMLIAMPGIEEPFERAVIYVCAHTDEMAMGLTVNQPVRGLTIADLLSRLEVGDAIRAPPGLVLVGGPVERERGFVLHTDDFDSEGSTLALGGGVSLTTTRDVLAAMANDSLRPRRSLLALGYAGWGAGQIEQELRENVWLVAEPDEAILFGNDHEHKWERALAKLGVDAGRLSGSAGRA